MNSIIPGTIEEPGLDTDKVGTLEAQSGGAVNMHTIKGQVAQWRTLGRCRVAPSHLTGKQEFNQTRITNATSQGKTG
jgi:hypothetical protein